MSIAFVIGRFQPYHFGHQALVNKALEVADEVVIVIGDTGCHADMRNPWTPMERVEMIAATHLAERRRLRFVTVEDIPYDDEAWKIQLQKAVHVFTSRCEKPILVGYKKDASSFYLDMFPDWQFISVEPVTHFGVAIDATYIRNKFFDDFDMVHIPRQVRDYLFDWRHAEPDRWKYYNKELRHIQQHDFKWNCQAVHEFGKPTHATVDVVLEAPDAVLMVRRGRGLGQGSLALPGGFVEPHERLLHAALRELREETGVEIGLHHLPPEKRFLVPFDHPKRSLNGRIITNVLHLPVSRRLPAEAGDDAAQVEWVDKHNIHKLKPQFFADHYHIVKHFIDKEAA